MALDTNTNLKAAIADYLARGDLTTQIPDFIHLAEKRIETNLNFVSNQNDTYTSSATLVASQDYIYAPIGCIDPILLRLDSDPIKEMNTVSLRELARKAQANTTGIPEAMCPVGNMRTGSITAFADATGGGAGDFVDASSTAHGLLVGDTVYITGTTNYNGKFTVTAVDDADTFEFEDTWVADDGASTWKTYQFRLLFDEAPSSAIAYTLYYRAQMTYLADTEVTWLLSNYPQLLLYGALVEASPFIKDDNRLPIWGAMFTDALDATKRQQWRRRAGGGELRVRPDVPLI
jgi:hypothetical protein